MHLGLPMEVLPTGPVLLAAAHLWHSDALLALDVDAQHEDEAL